MCLVAKTIVGQGSLIFLMMGERDSGEIDFIIRPIYNTRNSSFLTIDDYHIDNAFINFTKYGEIMEESEKDKKGENKDEIKNPFDTSIVKTYFNGHSSNKNNIYLMLIDTKKKKKLN